ncbi:cytochrome P450 [Mycobacterium sp. E796]|uniref:cytochrome P450 n=1 Tax=Mycobacterium sp. E796 TaxID=1834151 RepID=UPI000801D40E|nr:cytochrome P450 [Mycobacterium sp. E796]OBI52692.1 cytochrome [Mycobacterium sp. E796]
MTVTEVNDIRYDPYDVELLADPYPVFRRLREESPLYYNEQYDFYALSRFQDVSRALVDTGTFSSARGMILEVIKANIEIPPGIIVFEDPPVHDIHRKLLARMFTPRKIADLEDKIRAFCTQCLDPLVGTGRFDFIADLGAQMPMRVIGMLVGIPEDHQEQVRERSNAALLTEAGQPMTLASEGVQYDEVFAAYLDWRAEHPSDDITTELLNVEFDDEAGVRRKLTRDEILLYIGLVASAGNETTTRLLGWAGKVLADHPDQRREIAVNHRLIPQTIEELLRYESPVPHLARYVTRDTEWYGHTVPEGSVMMPLIASACRDHRQFPPDGDRFDIHRQPRQHLAFSVGAHFCLGAALARLEARIALEEIFKRFPEWDIDTQNAHLSSASAVRGWESMPAFI